MPKQSNNPNVPEISAATQHAFRQDLAEKVQKGLERHSKKLGWGDRLEAAAQAAEREELAALQQPPEAAKHSKKHKKKRSKVKTSRKRRHSSSDSDSESESSDSKSEEQRRRRHKAKKKHKHTQHKTQATLFQQ